MKENGGYAQFTVQPKDIWETRRHVKRSLNQGECLEAYEARRSYRFTLEQMDGILSDPAGLMGWRQAFEPYMTGRAAAVRNCVRLWDSARACGLLINRDRQGRLWVAYLPLIDQGRLHAQRVRRELECLASGPAGKALIRLRQPIAPGYFTLEALLYQLAASIDV